MFKNYLKVAIRGLRKQKMYSVINIAGLAIGMTCCVLILLWVQDELSYDRFHKHLDQLYRITVSTIDRETFRSSPWALNNVLKKDYPEIRNASWYSPRELTVKVDDRIYIETCGLVAPEFLEMFTWNFISGDPQTALTDINSIVLTEETARKYFGDENPLGKIVYFNNRVDLKVTGIIENVPSNSHMQFDLLAHPTHHYGEQRLRVWSMDCPSYVMLDVGADMAAVNEKIRDVINQQDSRTTNKYFIRLQPVGDIHLRALNGTDPIVYVYLFTMVAVIVLLIACVNFMNLATARSFKRAREVGMRKVVGASRGDVIRQFFGESIVLSMIAMFFSILLLYLFLPIFNNLAQKQLVLNFIQKPGMGLTMTAVALITGVISGSYPALFLSRFRPMMIMKNSLSKESKSHMLRKVLIIFQFSAVIVLIISTTIIFKQMDFIQNRDLGFKREQILNIPINRQFRAQYNTIKERLLPHMNIVNVTAASSIPLGIGNNNPFYWEGRGPENYESMNFVCVDYDYFETFEMDMAYGRPFSKEFPTDQQHYIINETALKLTGYKGDPIGRMFSMWRNEGVIVGVVKDFHGTSLHNEIRPIGFMLYENLPYFNMFVKIRPVNIPATIDYVESIVKEAVPDFVFGHSFLDDYFNRQYQQESRLRDLLKHFTFLAIFLSCLGLLGLISFMAEQRTKEIAIRKVLGARIHSIVFILSREFLVLVGMANLIAWPVSYYMMNMWIQGYVFHITIGWWIFVLSGLAAVVIAFAAVSFQTLKAAMANPVQSLKYE